MLARILKFSPNTRFENFKAISKFKIYQRPSDSIDILMMRSNEIESAVANDAKLCIRNFAVVSDVSAAKLASITKNMHTYTHVYDSDWVKQNGGIYYRKIY